MELVPGAIGAFEIIVDGETKYSKLKTRRFPENAEVDGLVGSARSFPNLLSPSLNYVVMAGLFLRFRSAPVGDAHERFEPGEPERPVLLQQRLRAR